MLPTRTLLVAAAVFLLAGCGSPSSRSQSKASGSGSEAQSAASGDIPDNQVFLTYRDPTVGYSLSYPEGWSRTGSGRHIAFRDKDNSVTLAVTKSGRPSAVKVRKTRLRRVGAPNPVTGKRPLLRVDRYVYSRGHELATLDLATPKGVDNVDAYRLIAKSFRWS